LWETRTGSLVAILRGHSGSVLSARFDRNGDHLLTASWDRTVRLWDGKTGAARGIISERECGTSRAIFGPDGSSIAAACSDRTARIWRFFKTTQEFVDSAKVLAPRCLSQSDRQNANLSIEPPAWCIEMDKWPYHSAEWKQWLEDTRAGKKTPIPVAK